MTNDNENPAAELRSLVDGFQLSQALHVAATLGIADALANGARTSDELAAESGANADALYRLLRALAAAGVFRERDDRRFELTPIGDRLRVDADESIAAWAVWIGQPSYWEAWGSLLHSVRTGENAFRHIHGTDVWVYRSTHPELSATFDRAMAGNARRTNTDLLASYDFSSFDTIVDVGGGTGAFLGAVLAATPSARGVLFDQTHVVAAASAVLDRLGVGDRCEIVGGSFFENVPPGADAYLMRAVLHDWEDDEVTRILEAVRRAIARQRHAARGRARGRRSEHGSCHQVLRPQHARLARRSGTHRRRVRHAPAAQQVRADSCRAGRDVQLRGRQTDRLTYMDVQMDGSARAAAGGSVDGGHGAARLECVGDLQRLDVARDVVGANDRCALTDGVEVGGDAARVSVERVDNSGELPEEALA